MTASANRPAAGPELRGLAPDALLSRLTELGVLLSAEGDRLRFDAPGAVATPELVDALGRNKVELLSLIRPGEKPMVVKRAPATLQQQGFITGHHHHGVPQVFNVAMRFTFSGPLNVTALRTSLSRLIARHESLRTRYRRRDGEWWQEILLPRPVELPVQDLASWPAEACEAEVERVSALVANTPYDLAADLRPRLRLLRTGESRWVLVLGMHHSTSDGWALSILLRDFAALYTAEVTGAPDGLSRAVQPTEYALWQRENAERAADARKLAYWTRRLDGAPFRLDLPLDRPRPEALSGRGGVAAFTITAGVREEVERSARRHGTTAFVITAALLGILLSRLSGQPEVVLNLPYANRERRELETMAAATASSFVLRVRVAEAPSFAALVEAVARDTVEGIANILPMWEVAAAVRERNGADMPDRVPVGLHYQNSLETDIEMPGLSIAIEDLAIIAARGEIAFGLVPTGGGFTGYVEYSTDLWDQATVERWARDYVGLLTRVGRSGME